MPTTQQKLLNLFVERNYKELLKLMPMHDMMHDAYVTVYYYHRPVVPTDERFRSLMQDAYHRHILREFNHQMHFILPDPLFWLYMDEDERMATPTEEEAYQAPSHTISDLSAYGLKQLFSFIRSNFSQEEYAIFEMAVSQQMSYSEIAKATGRTKANVKNVISKMEQAINQCRRPAKQKQPTNHK